MVNKKYFFFDIDGTLTVRETGIIVPSAKLALHKLQDAGHFVATATGRAHYKAKNFCDEIGIYNMVCSGGGGLVVDGKLLKNEPLDLELAKEIIRECNRSNIGVLLQLEDSINLYGYNDLFRQQVGGRSEPTEYIIDENLDFESLDKILKIYLSLYEEDEYRLANRDILSHYRLEPHVLLYQYDQKKKGIIDMMELLGGDLKDVVVFGDDVNDLVMFDDRWLSIAMGNACEELKKKANYICENNIDDGIYKTCLKFNWFEE